MKAVYIQQHAPIEGLRVTDRPEPWVNPGEVLVHVEAAGINPSDIASAEGRFPGAVLPRIIGGDFAGRIVRGPDEFIGAEVWGTGGHVGITREGTHAEYVAIPEEAVTSRPANLGVEEAAIAGVPFVTAFSAVVRLGQVRQGEWVIVSGAVGAVGQAAIQLAKAKGAQVIALMRHASELLAARSMNVEAIAQSDTGSLKSRKVNGKTVNASFALPPRCAKAQWDAAEFRRWQQLGPNWWLSTRDLCPASGGHQAGKTDRTPAELLPVSVRDRGTAR